MKLKLPLVLMLTFFISHFAISQEIFFKSGKNYTKYNYKNYLGEDFNGLESSSGSNYELGVEFFFNDSINSIQSRFSYSASLTFNQFNAKGANLANSYVWNSNYLGVQNMLYATLFKSKNDYLNLKFKAGVNAATFVSGKQYTNNVAYDLKQSDEFKGFIIQPTLGMDFRVVINPQMIMNLGYSFSKVYNASNNTSAEKLNFTNNLLQVGLAYTIY